MKKIKIYILISLLVFGGTTVALAQSNTPSENMVVCTQDAKQCSDGSYVGRVGPNCEFAECPNTGKPAPNGILQRIKNAFENKTQNKEEVKNKIQERIASSTAQRMEGVYERIAKRFMFTIEREEAIMAKIESRISKIEQATSTSAQTGVTEAKKFVAEAKIKLAEAKTNYETLKTMAIEADSNIATIRESLAGMKNMVKLIERNMREAHQNLQKTIGTLRGVSQLRNATSTNNN